MVNMLVNLCRLDLLIQKEDFPEELIFYALHALIPGLPLVYKPVDLESSDIVRREFLIEKTALFLHGMDYTQQASAGKEIILRRDKSYGNGFSILV